MTTLGFVDKYQRKTVGYPGGMYYGECLSLVKRYIQELYGIDPPASGVKAAWGYWDLFPEPLPQAFDRVAYELGKMPSPGDIVIWKKTAKIPNGHISIAVSGYPEGFISFEQNWYRKEASLVLHDYANVYGWLVRK